jgi:hypothetical protein
MIMYEESIACPHCGRVNDLQTSMLGHRIPQDGDGSICWKCRGVAIFVERDGKLTARPATAEEIAAREEIAEALGAMNANYGLRAVYDLFQGRR